MTEHNNTNASGARPTDGSDGASSGEPLDASWEAFAQEHADDLADVARSRNAKRFEKHAERAQKKAMLSVNDLDQGTFTDDAIGPGRGPRDTTASSWLDTDVVMDRYGGGFTPPTSFAPTSRRLIVFAALTVIGVLGIIASVLVPRFTGMLGTVFGAVLLVGIAGLAASRRGKRHDDPFDDGARV
ncbi:hypothetical protein [Bifidobacterium thermophilum]|uniref:hypothetical protein n=1 Tax=Bifidobacterium thermophilum TaxID=33905 RepID=UPI0030A14CD1